MVKKIKRFAFVVFTQKKPKNQISQGQDLVNARCLQVYVIQDINSFNNAS